MAADPKDTLFTASDRVKQLNEIDRAVVKLLQSAGVAVKALTCSGSAPVDEQTPKTPSVKQQQESFTAATSQYFALLSSVDVKLRRQIKALGQAQILSKETSSTGYLRDKKTTLAAPSIVPHMGVMPNTPFSKQTTATKGAITGGGLGGLDIGWLNSRNDNVGKAKEAELWEEAQRAVQKFEADNIRTESDAGSSREDVEMAEHSGHEQIIGHEMGQT